MRLPDPFATYDAALEWPDGDPLLDDHVPPSSDQQAWTPSEQVT